MGLVIFGSGGRAGRRKRKSLHSKLVRPPRRGEGMDDLSLSAAARKWKHHLHRHHRDFRFDSDVRSAELFRLSIRRSSITVISCKQGKKKVSVAEFQFLTRLGIGIHFRR